MTTPTLEVIATSNGLRLDWVDSNDAIEEQVLHLERDLFERYSAETADWLLALGFSDKEIDLPPVLAYWRDFAGVFVESLIHQEDLEEKREKAIAPWNDKIADEFLAAAPLFSGSENLSNSFFALLWLKLNNAYTKLIKTYRGSVEDFVHAFSPKLQLAGRVFFHLVENKKEGSPFAFLATYSISSSKTGGPKHLPLKHALKEHEDDREKLLELLGTVYRAARESAFLTELLERGELFHPLGWNEKQAFTFLKELPLYQRSGILCRIPNWWNQKSLTPRVGISIGTGEKGFVGMDALLECSPSMTVGGVEISREEAEKLLAESDGLSLIKNKWVAVDKDKLEQALAAYEKAEKMFKRGSISFREAMNFQLAPEKMLGANAEEVELGVTQGEWLQEIDRKLRNPSLVDAITPAKNFRGQLRPYQQLGLNWLGLLDGLGLGACLADDMGLGKTVQILAFLSYKKSQNIKTLLIVPASLIANWSSEINRFFPELEFLIAHPQYLREHGISELSEKDISSTELVITTYSMAQRYSVLKNFNWDYIILDEAQAIKNPGTKQAKEIKKYSAKNRIILSGTPVENHLGDLWSLFDFLNPGLLGTITEFKDFSKKLKENRDGYGRLRKVISPYILRRLKTDRSIIDDLPEKVEMKSYSELSKKQTVLYQELLAELKSALESAEGIKRRGLILSSLIKFKQLCNHPDQFLGSKEYLEEESGKFKRLREICEVISEKREKMLLFTQFKELCEPLHNFLSSVFGRNGLLLHGSTPVKKRKEIVDTFQTTDNYLPFMVMSLKAGGVGLNLTEANHVVHFDRWWNPAVENQATDRAFRIGQKNKVLVHKFITKGTIEEKIDEMLEEKSKLSAEIINTSAETKLTELKNDDLLSMFRLK